MQWRDIPQSKEDDPKKRSESLSHALEDANEIMRGKVDFDPKHPTMDEIEATIKGCKPAALMGVVRGLEQDEEFKFRKLQADNDAMRARVKAAGLVEVISWLGGHKTGQIVFVKPGNEHIARAILDPNTSNKERGLLLGYGLHSKETKIIWKKVFSWKNVY